MTSLALIVAGGIYLSAHLPREVPLTPAVVLLVASALLLAGNLVALARVHGFAWWRFAQVGKWALLAYAITAGLIEYAFLRNGVSGGAARRADALARGLRGPRAGADRLHRRALRGAGVRALTRPWRRGPAAEAEAERSGSIPDAGAAAT